MMEGYSKEKMEGYSRGTIKHLPTGEDLKGFDVLVEGVPIVEAKLKYMVEHIDVRSNGVIGEYSHTSIDEIIDMIESQGDSENNYRIKSLWDTPENRPKNIRIQGDYWRYWVYFRLTMEYFDVYNNVSELFLGLYNMKYQPPYLEWYNQACIVSVWDKVEPKEDGSGNRWIQTNRVKNVC